jgi:hypothetical protein
MEQILAVVLAVTAIKYEEVAALTQAATEDLLAHHMSQRHGEEHRQGG